MVLTVRSVACNSRLIVDGRQLDAGRVELHFDNTTKTCNILPVEENPAVGDGDE